MDHRKVGAWITGETPVPPEKVPPSPQPSPPGGEGV